ncbi:DNA phosphorothioation-dependent restriction protein DptF [Endozoicomonas sp. ALE010]|uniref:DNA phosphorothioation-dependent restriction protein DptF n=1 Tax=Endozoicomonas sp. ALE010 TaxID=3403081 RepID=UPI003BB66B9C
MNLRTLLDTLSRSSAQAVSTLGNSSGNPVKDYLYIKTAIESAFQSAIKQATSPEKIIFLCGSSGDGKSEILTRYYKQYSSMLNFHLDATHSFQPDMSAMETLDQVFVDHKHSDKPLVVGINIGMLGNYAEEGAEEHGAIIDSIRAFLDDKYDEISPEHVFLNFEDFPKFEPENDQIVAPFIQDLLTKITQPTQDNPFYAAWQREVATMSGILYVNYRLLQYTEIQQVIIRTLLKVRLKYEQFLTARTLLDFVHQLLTGPGHLFDNLFTSRATELAKALAHFDPCTIRSKDIDLFLVQKSLNIANPEFNAFQEGVSDLVIREEMSTGSWIRFFYLIQDLDLSNNYHHRFVDDFRSQLYEQYIQVWLLHQQYTGASAEKKALREFYRKGILEALFRFANRFAPELTSRNQLFLAEYNGYQLSTRADIKESLKRIGDYKPKRLGYFEALLKLDDDDLPPVPVSSNFLDLILKINSGYRPNKHDKNNIVILEELIDDITRRVRGTDKLHIHKNDQHWVLINDQDEEEIIVEGRE